MLEHDQLRKTLETQVITVVTALGFPCQIGDESFVPPTNGAIFGQFWFRTGKTKQMELGSRKGFECTAGVFQFTLYAPEKMGSGAVLRLAGQLKKPFNRQQYLVPPDGYVTLEAIGIQNLGVKDGNYVVIVDTTFDFYHRDPTAIDSVL